MLIEETLDKLNTMKIGAMADACRQQMQTDEAAALAFEERLGLLVEELWETRCADAVVAAGRTTPRREHPDDALLAPVRLLGPHRRVELFRGRRSGPSGAAPTQQPPDRLRTGAASPRPRVRRAVRPGPPRSRTRR